MSEWVPENAHTSEAGHRTKRCRQWTGGDQGGSIVSHRRASGEDAASVQLTAPQWGSAQVAGSCAGLSWGSWGRGSL